MGPILPRPPSGKRLSGLMLALAGLGPISACDTLTCGEGTFREGDRCVPAVQVGCAEGTTYREGRCVLSADAGAPRDGGPLDGGGDLTCGPGTAAVADECRPSPDGGVAADLGADRGPAADLGADAEPADADPLDAGPQDAEPDAEAPACPVGLVPGTPPAGCAAVPPGGHCVVGVALDFLTGCALPAGLPVAVIDPTLAIQGQNPTIGVGAVAGAGTFAVAAVGPAGQLALILDEAPETPAEDDLWARSLNGVSAAPLSGETYRATAFASPAEAVRGWSQALGLGPDGLLTRGFLVGRVLDAERRPVAGARLLGRANSDLTTCGPGALCVRYFRADGQGFEALGAAATTAAGGFLVLGPGTGIVQDAFYLQGREATYADVPAGVSPGSGFHTAFVPRP